MTNDYTIPTAIRMVDDLPLWVLDEMQEELSSEGSVVGLVHGALRALPDR